MHGKYLVISILDNFSLQRVSELRTDQSSYAISDPVT